MNSRLNSTSDLLVNNSVADSPKKLYKTMPNSDPRSRWQSLNQMSPGTNLDETKYFDFENSRSMNLPALLTERDLRLMDRTAVNIRTMIDSLRLQLDVIDDDLKAAERSKKDLANQMMILNEQKKTLESKIADHKEFGVLYDKQIEPITHKYADLNHSIAELYNQAKKGHKNGIVLLKKEFGYHPAFKRPGDTFSAIPFHPK